MEQSVVEVSCAAADAAADAAAAQLVVGRRGHFSLSASRCNADGSQGYVCPTTPTDWSIEDARAGIPRDNN